MKPVHAGALTFAICFALCALIIAVLCACDTLTIANKMRNQQQALHALRFELEDQRSALYEEREFFDRAWVEKSARLVEQVAAVWQRHEARLNTLLAKRMADRALLDALVAWANDLYRYLKNHPRRAAVCP
jgi:hypothetical protein